MFREYLRDKVAAQIEEIIEEAGEIRSREVHKALSEQGYSKNTISRAATLAGVTSFQKSGENASWWKIVE